jgi:hypothetical protein
MGSVLNINKVDTALYVQFLFEVSEEMTEIDVEEHPIFSDHCIS